MKVGDKIYNFDPNHREYERDANGKSIGGALYIKHWREETIIGETKVSWVVGYEFAPIKVNKKKLASGELHGYKATWSEVEDLAWLKSNSYKIARLIQNESDIAKVKAIAEIIGYKEEGK